MQQTMIGAYGEWAASLHLKSLPALSFRNKQFKAGAAEHYKCSFYPGPHKFDKAMQSEAFEFFNRYLKEK